MKESTTNLKEAAKEFKDVVTEYLLPLIDVRGNIKLKYDASKNKELVEYIHTESGDSVFRFYPRMPHKDDPENRVAPYFCEIGTYSNESLKKRLTPILREILKVLEYNCFGNVIRKQRSYGTSNTKLGTYKDRTIQLAFELGMCQWIVPNIENAATLHSIIFRLEDWAGRTYEGKNVPFGLVVDFGVNISQTNAVSARKALQNKKDYEEKAKEEGSYLRFLKSDNSAVFTDGIFSGIRLDQNGELISFITRKTEIPPSNHDFVSFVPYQFEDIAQHCVANAVGIILQSNGEILIIKNRSICFAKRGNKWVSFDWERVRDNLYPYFMCGNKQDNKIIERKIKEIYCTLLDVSFSHTGGCLAIVIPGIKSEDISKIIKERFDLSLSGKLPEGVSSESLEKIEILKHLVSDSVHINCAEEVGCEQIVDEADMAAYHATGMNSFFKLDKPLRKEILSLDGATVVSLNGFFYCAGSIVSVHGGSSGGGRSAAAKRLAQMGVGIKISEDGYIEAYGLPIGERCGNEKSGSNSRIVQLFKIK